MAKVLARRDDNWKKLQQYVLDEKEAFDLTGPGRFPLFGMRRDYTWFIRDGIFVRSPISADGVKLSESDRKKAEDEWLRRQKRREAAERRRAEQRAKGEPVDERSTSIAIGPGGVDVSSSDDRAVPISSTDDMLKQMREPQFVSSAYFLKFRFENGRYALAGREKINGFDALKIEYYPGAGLFKDDRDIERERRRQERDKERGRDNSRSRQQEQKIEQQMNKASMVTLWVEPKTHQILQYTFDDLDWDFFPGSSIVRVDNVLATMQMAQAFPDVWLPKSIEMQFGMMSAVGGADATYRVDYLNYKEAAVSYRIK
ncbi:MAG TPA: hypothetical protein VNT81_15445 [Vicinamibacterales bacterium]|nr:hypothetical protein [Vicinamibacterales bacterium]